MRPPARPPGRKCELRKGVTAARKTRVFRDMRPKHDEPREGVTTARITRGFRDIILKRRPPRNRAYTARVCCCFRDIFLAPSRMPRRWTDARKPRVFRDMFAGGRECHRAPGARASVMGTLSRPAGRPRMSRSCNGAALRDVDSWPIRGGDRAGGRGRRIGFRERLLGVVRAVPPHGAMSRVRQRRPQRSRCRLLGSIAADAGGGGIEPDALWRHRPSPRCAPSRPAVSVCRRCAPLCGGFAAALRAVRGSPAQFGTSRRLRACRGRVLQAVRCGSLRFAATAPGAVAGGACSPLRCLDERRHGLCRGSPRRWGVPPPASTSRA